MENPPHNKFLEFRSDTFHAVRNLNNLDQPGRMKEAVSILDEWVKKQKHFVKKDFNPIYLETIILDCKGSLERAKRQIDKLCTYRTLMPNFFSKIDVNKDFGNLFEVVDCVVLPKLTPEHYRLCLVKLLNERIEASQISDLLKSTITVIEHLKRHDYCNGFVYVGDFRLLNLMDILTKFNPVELRKAFTIYMEGYGVRIKGIHFISSSKVVDGLVTILKQILSEKLANRIVIHKTVESLYDYVPQEILPKEYGGEERSLKNLMDEYIDILGSEEHISHLREMLNAKTNESCREADKFNELYAGMPGTFRALTVD